MKRQRYRFYIWVFVSCCYTVTGLFGMALEIRKAQDGGQNISSHVSTFGIA